MQKLKKIKTAGYCRECINEVYGTHLNRNEVNVYIYPNRCERCKMVKNIVYSIKPNSRWKLLFARHQ